MKAIARLNNCPLTPRKMRLVVDQIRGQKVEDALNTLKFNNKKAYAEYVEKLLLSAVANWEQKNDVRVDEETQLAVIEVYVNQGRMLKRLRPAPQGRAHRIRKRSNHITLVVDSLSGAGITEEKESKEEQEIEA
ncbi:MAG: 50S ribosomal protein L22 [Bacteroidetes bacterium MED-G17]|nr:MAG: 50S ribosomal protein L22 [Bacteroidetes bacterium TMED39]PDH51948.1 MAG: 50S ribosomal protein L22 [Bacteroidetes bacterium MED-G17]CAI8368242.1 MAG: 50S ribosomal protein L22 [Bacteroidetes bacterium MED-G17]|tara:strand:- start:91 stop:492 length:402 start_codon:yes stop_codon:yes gene_type:complete